jgi:hypothetical protein
MLVKYYKMITKEIFQNKLNNLLYKTNNYQTNSFIKSLSELFNYYYGYDWNIIEYSNQKIIWKNEKTNNISVDGKFIREYFITNFQLHLQFYEKYLHNLLNDYKMGEITDDVIDIEWKIKQKILKMDELYELFLDKNYHDKLVYYISLLVTY